MKFLNWKKYSFYILVLTGKFNSYLGQQLFWNHFAYKYSFGLCEQVEMSRFISFIIFLNTSREISVNISA